MRKFAHCAIAVLTILCLFLRPLAVSALESVDTTRCGSLLLEYSSDGVGFSGLEIRIYRIAEIHADGGIDLVAPFDGYPVNIHGIQSQKEWADVADTLAAYIAADQILPTAAVLTDEQGNAAFPELETGVYLVLGVSLEQENRLYTFENFCLFLPRPLEDGTMQYDLVAKPKYTVTTNSVEISYRVVKLWKDTGDEEQRPVNVTVDILKDGALQETVILSAENDWSYSWSAQDDGSQWVVVEKNIPEGYTVTITANQTVFTITNTGKDPDPEWPQTGDDFPLIPCLMAMSLSGIGLVLCGLYRKRVQG